MNIMQIKINDEWCDVIGIIYHNENAPCDILRGKSIDGISDIRMEQPQEKSRLEILEEGLDNVCNQIDALEKRIDELEETVAKYEATKSIISQDEAFDKAGLNAIEMWVARELYGDVLLSDNKAEPTDEEGYDGLKYPEGTRLIELGRKVFPSLTRANSPQKVELKMIDNDD
jgi:hypothetical protein